MSYFTRLVALNGLRGVPYVEPYAGGASLALSLLYSRVVSEIYLNDLDRSIFAFWYAVTRHNREFVNRVIKTPITVTERERQKITHKNRAVSDLFDLGFATFFLNRTNRSGVLNGGVIGGKDQDSEWKIDARFNRANLIERLRRVGKFARQIHVSGDDALKFLESAVPQLPIHTLMFLDPPYYQKGRELYLNAYRAGDHASIRRAVGRYPRRNWVVSYDDVPAVRALYSEFRSRKALLRYSVRVSRTGKEVLFFSDALRLPRAAVVPT